jgi:TonB family protein
VEAPLPLYPERFVQRGVTGNVTVRVTIGRDGRVTQATIAESQIPEIDSSVVAVAKRWTFQPLTGAASAEARIVFRFSLQ